MRRILSLGVIALLLIAILYACNLLGGGTSNSPNAGIANLSVLSLAVQAQNGGDTFNKVGQVIHFVYTVSNSGSVALAGPVTVTSDKGAVNCPAVNSVGNLDNNLDSQESLACTSDYAITQVDLDNGSVTNNSSAAAGGVNSNSVATTVPMALAQVLAITSTASPTTYNQAQQTINFTFTIKNTGTAALGPAQFVVKDSLIGTFNCGGAQSILGPSESLTCTATYTTTTNDVGVNQLTFSATATGASATTAQPATVTLTNTANPGGGGGSTNLTPGSTIKHKVNDGEWMLQIARCYGADFNAVRLANPQVLDPDRIWPDIDVLTIPNIGSNGKIYGPPCVIKDYVVQSGETWESIAQKYNADLAVLLEANKGITLTPGAKLRIPLNSANGNPISTPSSGPTRLNFPNGSGNVTVTGTISASQSKVRYVLTAKQGQTITVQVTSPGAGLGLAVLAASGTALKAQDTNLSWSGIIPANGDYYIDVVNVAAVDKVFTLAVSLSTTPSTGIERAADINSGAGDSNPSYLAEFNNVLYFNATGSDNAGAELWKYDAASNAAARVADINPGANGSNPAFLASFNNALYFSADGGDGAGVELWRFNGTDTGRLTDLNNGSGSSNPSYMTIFGNFLYFSANGNDGAGVELWRTDGNTANRVTDIYNGAGDANPAYLAVFNNALYFSATSNDGAGTELWKYDGNTATRVTDINPGVGNSNPSFLTVFNNALYFSANGGDGAGAELWKYDGASATRAADINPGAGDSIPTYLTLYKNALYFSANGNDGAGFELWKFDGNAATRVSDINKTGDANPAFLVVYNNNLYFAANGGDGAGRELWRYTGP